ncbi:hypothetical protein QR77_41445 [Streptomyces sp. 150FB]|uniref:hypothetical protein n=1 Tax=Streptomyces sp. 150FB TaxID=1576605 RepID=UPI0005894760|nr:hypothetical protein [Streptomyces sp. 150FB]KIF72750.1 hypothetical protein QR77_41445 [Streptomyces sp. 150FB]
MSSDKKWMDLYRSPRGIVLAALGVITLGVAVLSVFVSYGILDPAFGAWAVPTVGALDALWLVFQATEILAGNNAQRAQRVRWAGLILTGVNAAIPTVHLIMATPGEFDLAMVLTPVAILATKIAWWVALPSLGRKVSAATRQSIDDKRQEVADRLEEMEAEASHRVELLETATALEKRVAEAETAYRMSVLKTQQSMTEELHSQAEATAKTVADQPLPSAVTEITLPVLETWKPGTAALPGRAGSGTVAIGPSALGAQVSGVSETGVPDSGTPFGMPGVPESGTPGGAPARAITLAELAAVAGVPVPEVGEKLTDGQMEVVLRQFRYSDDPPLSYRQAMSAFRAAGFVGSEERVRRVWAGLMSKEETGSARTVKSEASEDSEDEPEDAAV